MAAASSLSLVPMRIWVADNRGQDAQGIACLPGRPVKVPQSDVVLAVELTRALLKAQRCDVKSPLTDNASKEPITPSTVGASESDGMEVCTISASSTPRSRDSPVACAPSAGSIGHPHRCSQPCKFFWKRNGCKDGDQCDRCHLCPWSRNSERHESTNKEFGQNPMCTPCVAEVDVSCGVAWGATGDVARVEFSPPGMAAVALPSDEPLSLGSLGHDVGVCAEGCRYFRRKGGCRDGRHCTKCHRCTWSRNSPAKSPNSDQNDYQPGKLFLSSMYGIPART